METKTKISVQIVDNYSLTCKSLFFALNKNEDIDVVGAFSELSELIESEDVSSCDVLLVNIRSLGNNIGEQLSKIRVLNSDIRIVAYGNDVDCEMTQKCYEYRIDYVFTLDMEYLKIAEIVKALYRNPNYFSYNRNVKG